MGWQDLMANRTSMLSMFFIDSFKDWSAVVVKHPLPFTQHLRPPAALSGSMPSWSNMNSEGHALPAVIVAQGCSARRKFKSDCGAKRGYCYAIFPCWAIWVNMGQLRVNWEALASCHPFVPLTCQRLADFSDRTQSRLLWSLILAFPKQII